MARWTGTWLSGARPAERSDYPGERLGLPSSGSGSLAGVGRRLGALAIDWLVALAIARLAFGGNHVYGTPMFFALIYLLLVPTLGCTVGMRVFGIRLMRVGGHRVTLGWTAVRTALLLLVVPAVIYDRDYRGLHDRAADTVVVRA